MAPSLLRFGIHFTLLIAMGFRAGTAWAEGKKDKDVGVGGMVGIPELLGFQFRYLGIEKFEFALGYGQFPINRILQSQIPIESIPLDLSLPNQYALVPYTQFSLTDFSFHTRFFPGDGGFFLQLSYSVLRFQASFGASLANLDTKANSFGVVSGSLSLTQPLIGPAIGYQLYFNPGIYIDIALGAGFTLKTTNTVSIGGTISNLLPLIPEADEAFEKAKEDIKTQVSEGVSDFSSQLKAIPTLGLSVGIAF